MTGLIFERVKPMTDDEYEKLVIKEANKISKKYNCALEKIKKFL